MGKAPMPHNKRNCYPPYPDHYFNILLLPHGTITFCKQQFSEKCDDDDDDDDDEALLRCLKKPPSLD